MGSLALLLAETTEGAKQMFAGLPASDVVNKTGNYLQACVELCSARITRCSSSGAS